MSLVSFLTSFKKGVCAEVLVMLVLLHEFSHCTQQGQDVCGSDDNDKSCSRIFFFLSPKSSILPKVPRDASRSMAVKIAGVKSNWISCFFTDCIILLFFLFLFHRWLLCTLMFENSGQASAVKIK